MTESRITQLLNDIQSINPERYAVLQAVRALVLGLSPDISEEVKYGGLMFSADQPFCGVFAYTHHVSLEMGEGAALADPFKVLEGSGKHRRHIKLSTPEDIVGKQVAHYLKAALAASRCAA